MADDGTPGFGLPLSEQERMVEALLFAAPAPLSLAALAERMPAGADPGAALERLRSRYQGRGIALVRVAGGWAFRTAPDLAHLLRRDVVEPRRLSRAAIETLAIIAYHQPVTRAEIEEIRGVSVSRGTIDLLMELGWVRLGRRRQAPGRPVTFLTTAEFLDHFNLASERDLPGLAELRAAGMLDTRPGPGGAPGTGAEEAAAGDDAAEDDDAAAPGTGRPGLFD